MRKSHRCGRRVGWGWWFLLGSSGKVRAGDSEKAREDEGYKRFKEEMIVVGHWGVIEEGSHACVAGVLKKELFSPHICVLAALKAIKYSFSCALNQCRILPSVMAFNLATKYPWYWFQARSKPSFEKTPGSPFSSRYAWRVSKGTWCRRRSVCLREILIYPIASDQQVFESNYPSYRESNAGRPTGLKERASRALLCRKWCWVIMKTEVLMLKHFFPPLLVWSTTGG